MDKEQRFPGSAPGGDDRPDLREVWGAMEQVGKLWELGTIGSLALDASKDE